ncbi:MAG: EAL domain-containing protein [Pusillimonas sp.]|nr:EAL domain-containing protein [Pusillimonas sp.]
MPRTSFSHRSNYHFPLWLSISFVLAALVGLATIFVEPVEDWARRYYLTWHLVLEIASIAFAFAVFALGWSTYRKHPQRNILYLACAFLGVALLDIAHTLSFEGMPTFVTPNNPEKAIYFWLVARYLAAIGLLIVVWLPWPSDNELPLRHGRLAHLAWPLSIAFGVVILTHGVVLYAPTWLPTVFSTETGLSDLKIIAEYGIITLHILALAILLRRLPNNSECNFYLLASALLLMAVSELLFTSYTAISDTAMLLGHVYKAAAYLLLYMALDTGHLQPPPFRTQQLERALEGAIKNGQMRLAFQPVMRLSDGRLSGAEVLIRWTHPRLGIIGPAEFIPVAEKSGLMPEIGEWVLKNAIAQISLWVRQGLPPDACFSVNLSLVQFRYPLLVERIQYLLKTYHLPTHYLGLEITESVAMHNAESAIQTLHTLRKQGISLSIDDFGTGHASLSHLKLFNANTLKIDQSFVRDLTRDARDRALVRAIVDMAHALGMRTIAEGVETDAQLEALKALGCDQVQGYYFSRPLTTEEFEAFSSLHRHTQPLSA